ncbi:MAG: SDR family oxidoreductase [Bacteroidota bacterium]
MQGKNCVVTGATSGIGFETALELAKRGANVAILARNEQKGQDAVQSITSQSGSKHVHLFPCELASQEQIRSTGSSILDQFKTIDVLVNNAGTWFSKYTLTTEGIEMQFAVNHLSYFLLTHLLYPGLVKADQGRIINVGSDSHFQGKMHFDNLNLTNKYHGLRAYAQSKLANALFTYEFERRKQHRQITINCVQPGLVKTDIGVKNTKPFHRFAWKVRRSGGVSPKEGAQTQIYLATAEEVGQMSGKYWDKCKTKSSSELSYNQKDAELLWERSLELCGIKDYFKV